MEYDEAAKLIHCETCSFPFFFKKKGEKCNLLSHSNVLYVMLQTATNTDDEATFYV